MFIHPRIKVLYWDVLGLAPYTPEMAYVHWGENWTIIEWMQSHAQKVTLPTKNWGMFIIQQRSNDL